MLSFNKIAFNKLIDTSFSAELGTELTLNVLFNLAHILELKSL